MSADPQGRLTVRRRRPAIVIVFTTAMLVVLAVTVSAGHGHARAVRRTPASAGGATAPSRAAVSALRTAGNGARRAGAGRVRAASRNQSRRLAAALEPVLVRRTGDLAVGVIDKTTGRWALYNSAGRFHTASIVKADILAALLLRHQAAGTSLTCGEEELAARMIEDSDNDAATDLWQDDDAADGVADADEELGLRHTTPGAGGCWGLTSTTVTDQLRLLLDLTSAGSPLSAASRRYELSLMRRVEADQAWGVGSAATSGTASALKNGWLPDPELWVINSIGMIHRDGQVLLVAVLSDDQPSQAAGIAQVQAAATAATAAVGAAS